MTDQQREGIQMLWSLGKSHQLIARQLGLSLADVCSAIAALSGRPAAAAQMRQMELFSTQPQRDRVSDK